MSKYERPKEVVSYVMSRNKGKDTKPEIIVRKYLFSHGLRYRKNDRKYPEQPDVVLPIIRLYSFMGVSGIIMKDVHILLCRR